MKNSQYKNCGKGNTTVLIVVAFVLLGGYLIYRVFHEPDMGNLCTEVLPQNQRVGIKVEALSDGVVKVDLSGQRGVQTGATPDQIDAFVRCIEATKRKVLVENAIRIPLEPVGQVANRWKRETGLQLRLMPGGDNVVLNNLRIGPATGPKENVVAAWCSPQQAGACVICDPDRPTTDTVEVLVRLQDKAPVEKKQLDGVWPLPPSGIQPGPWQLLNEKSERFYYECKVR